MCLQCDLDLVCTHGWCRGHRLGSLSLFVQGGTASMGGKENIFPIPQTYWLSSTIFSEWFGTSHFSLSVLVGTRRCISQEARQQQSAAGNSWLSQTSLSDLPAAGSAESHSKAALSLSFLCLWCWPCSMSELVDFLRTWYMWVEMKWGRAGPSSSYLPPCVL